MVAVTDELLFEVLPAYQSADAVGPAVVEPALNKPVAAAPILPTPLELEFKSMRISCVPFVPRHHEWAEPLLLLTNLEASKAVPHKSVTVLTEAPSHEAACVQTL